MSRNVNPQWRMRLTGALIASAVGAAAVGGALRARGALDAVPPNSLVVATLDLQALRKSAFAPLLRAAAASVPMLGAQETRCGFSIATRVNVAALSIAPGDRAELGAAFTGTFSADELQRCAGLDAIARGTVTLTPQSEVGEFSMYSASDPRARVGVSRRGPVLIGLGTWVDEMARAASNPDPARALGEHAAMRESLRRELGGDAVVVMASIVLSSALKAQMREQMPAALRELQFADLLTVGAAVSVGDDERTRLAIVVECTNEAACVSVRTLVMRAHFAASQKLSLRLAGLAELLDSVRAVVVPSAAGRFVMKLHAEDSAPHVVALLQRVLHM